MKPIKVNCYRKEHINSIKEQCRDNKGRFSSRYIKICFYLFMIISILSITYISQFNKEIKYVEKDKIVLINNAQDIINNEKISILDTLENCESSGNGNSINWNDYGYGKNTASFGSFMFKIGTIQLFQKGLTDFQAIELASDKVKSRELASYIIFDTKDGIYNWKKCMLKYGLLERINFVKQLKSKI